MTEDQLISLYRQMLNPPKPPPLTYEQMMERYEQAIQQLRRSDGNMGSDSPAIPDCWGGLKNVGGGAEHCVIIPPPRRIGSKDSA
jgi:hypothetical protein